MRAVETLRGPDQTFNRRMGAGTARAYPRRSAPGARVEVVRQRCKDLQHATGAERHEVFETHPPATRRVVEPGLQGEDVPLRQHPFETGGLAEAGQLVQLVADAVAEAVDV